MARVDLLGQELAASAGGSNFYLGSPSLGNIATPPRESFPRASPFHSPRASPSLLISAISSNRPYGIPNKGAATSPLHPCHELTNRATGCLEACEALLGAGASRHNLEHIEAYCLAQGPEGGVEEGGFIRLGQASSGGWSLGGARHSLWRGQFNMHPLMR